MPNNLIVHSSYKRLSQSIQVAIDNFDTYQDVLGDGDRNVIKIIHIDGKKYTIKSFKIPNVINQVIYRFFRKSKAERSYQYANKLLDINIKTPAPIAYQEESTSFLFKKSYYMSELLAYDITFRELIAKPDYPDQEKILRAFTGFTFDLHQKGVNFLDHSPGNTLIVKTSSGYNFYLVDLNRMNFGKMDFDTRIYNFCKLTTKKEMVVIMSNEYAKLTGEDEALIFRKMWKFTQDFQQKYYRKKELKKKIFFWKKKYRA